MARATRPARTARGRASRAADGPSPSAARSLLAGLVALLALRVLAAFVPGRWLWGEDLGRDLAPLSFAVPLVIALALCLPSVGRRVAAILPREGSRANAIATLLALALALFAWSHPDRALFTGDTSLRHGAFAAVADPTPIAAQALRGDLLLHHTLPRWMALHSPWSAEDTGRTQGALLAFLTAIAAWRLARALGTRGALAFAVAAIAACSGALALDNGYAKSCVELAFLTTLIALGLVHAAKDGGGLGTVGSATAAGLLLHRSALMLLPAWIVAVVLAVRAGRAREARSLAGFAAPPVAIALVAPRLVRVLTGFDVEHHTASGGLLASLAAAFAPMHLLDALHTLVLLAPLAPLLPLLLAVAPRPERREWLGIAALLAPPVALLVLVIPQHGLARDWDVFAFAGSALAAVLAWRVARVLSQPGVQGVAIATAFVAATPALQWAALQSDASRMWTRAEAILVGPPARSASERADGLGTIGMMRFGRGQYDAARQLFERSTEAAPNPRTFVEWGMAETMLGRHALAMAHYRHAATLNPDLPTAWRGVAAAASALGDRAAMLEAVTQLERLEPGSRTAVDGRAWLEANPGR